MYCFFAHQLHVPLHVTLCTWSSTCLLVIFSRCCLLWCLLYGRACFMLGAIYLYCTLAAPVTSWIGGRWKKVKWKSWRLGTRCPLNQVQRILQSHVHFLRRLVVEEEKGPGKENNTQVAVVWSIIYKISDSFSPSHPCLLQRSLMKNQLLYDDREKLLKELCTRQWVYKPKNYSAQ